MKTTESILAAIAAIVEKHINSTDYYLDGDDFNPADFSGGNFDDAFSMGIDQGYGDLAREIHAVMTRGA